MAGPSSPPPFGKGAHARNKAEQSCAEGGLAQIVPLLHTTPAFPL